MYQGRAKSSGKSEFGTIADAVLQVCHGIENKNHKLFIDNLFTSLPLLKILADNGIYTIGTLRVNRAKEAVAGLVDSKLLKRGWNSITSSEDNITVMRWQDNRPVHVISTYAGAEPEDEAERWDRKTRTTVHVPRPFAIAEYNRFMGGVDLCDRMVAHYPHGFKNRKWYLRVFFHLMNIALTNAWIIWREKAKEEKKAKHPNEVSKYLIFPNPQLSFINSISS